MTKAIHEHVKQEKHSSIAAKQHYFMGEHAGFKALVRLCALAYIVRA